MMGTLSNIMFIRALFLYPCVSGAEGADTLRRNAQKYTHLIMILLIIIIIIMRPRVVWVICLPVHPITGVHIKALISNLLLLLLSVL